MKIVNLLEKIKNVAQSVQLNEERLESIERILNDMSSRLEILEKERKAHKQDSSFATKAWETVKDTAQLAVNVHVIVTEASKLLL